MPWIKWFPADWLADPELGRATPAARGLWIEVLNIMYHSNSCELSGSPTELARTLRFTEKEFSEALNDLLKTNIAICTCHKAQNGLVTLVSRRLERLLNHRNNNRLRQQRLRGSKDCSAEVASAYASASDLRGVQGGKKTCDFPDRKVELPKGFPDSVDEAVRLAGHCGADATFISTLWNSAMAQGGITGNGRPITSWQHYVAKHWPGEQAKRAQAKASGKPDPTKRIEDVVREGRDREIKNDLKQIERMENEFRREL